MNEPYVQSYEENGVLLNPITKENPYLHQNENRKQRRKELQKFRFHGNGKNYHLTVVKTAKYVRSKQVVFCRDKKTGKLTGKRKVIEHYLNKTL
jgi:hypothetical protein